MEFIENPASGDEILTEYAATLNDIPELKFLKEDTSHHKVSILCEPFMNTLVLVESEDGQHSVVLKHGAGKILMQDDDAFLHRQVLEFNSLKLLHEIQPGCVPVPYDHNTDVHTMAMEHLKDMTLVGDVVRKGELSREVGSRVGSCLAKMHFHTHRDNVDASRWTHIQESFRSDMMHNMLKYVRFQRKFDVSDPLTVMPEGGLETFKECVKQIKDQNLLKLLMGKFDEVMCLTHRDSHTNAFLFNSDRMVMIDFELTLPGHPAYDLAVFLANLALAAGEAEARRQGNNSEEQVRQEAGDFARACVDAYLEVFAGRMDLLGGTTAYLADVTAFTGSSLFQLSTYGQLQQIATLTAEQKVGFLKKGHSLLMHFQDVADTESLIKLLF